MPAVWAFVFLSAMAKTSKKFTNAAQPDLFAGMSDIPGAGDDDAMVRAVLTDTIKRCAKKRIQIAEELSTSVGRQISEAMLNAFTADSKENHRWPTAWTRAFCQVTGDYRLLRCTAERAGFQLITTKQVHLLQLAEQLIARETSERSLRVSLEQALSEGQE